MPVAGTVQVFVVTTQNPRPANGNPILFYLRLNTGLTTGAPYGETYMHCSPAPGSYACSARVNNIIPLTFSGSIGTPDLMDVMAVRGFSTPGSTYNPGKVTWSVDYTVP